MTVPLGTFQAHSAKGNREDLSDIVHDITPMDTPFMSNVARGSADAVLVEWQTDSLASAAVNSQVEGDDAATDTASPTTRLGNYCNLSWKVPRVSGTQRSVDSAGRRDELSYQTAKRGRELKRDIETALLGLQAASAGGVATARVCAGVAAYLWTNQVTTSAGATTPTVSNGAPTTAPTAGTSPATVSETDLKDAISACWDEGGDPTVVMCGSYNKKQISGFAGIATLYRDSQGMQPASILGAADAYVSDFGQHQIVANRFMPAANIYVLDLEYWEVQYLRPIQQAELAKTGDSDRRMILAEYTLCAKQPDSSAKIYTTATS